MLCVGGGGLCRLGYDGGSGDGGALGVALDDGLTRSGQAWRDPAAGAGSGRRWRGAEYCQQAAEGCGVRFDGPNPGGDGGPTRSHWMMTLH